MVHKRKLFGVVFALLVLLSLTAPAALAQDPANGKVVWEEQTGCKNCHGPQAQGLWAAPLAGSEKTAQEWIAQVRNPRRNMPMFSPQQVSDQQVIDMHAYVSSLPKVTDFKPQDAGLPADAPAGQQLLVEKRCVACHTTTGPIQNFVKRGETPTAAAVIKQLRTPARFMPSFSVAQVSDEEAGQIAEFLAMEFAASSPMAPAEPAPAAPAALPQTGGLNPAGLPVVGFVLLGLSLVLAGLSLRRRPKI